MAMRVYYSGICADLQGSKSILGGFFTIWPDRSRKNMNEQFIFILMSDTESKHKELTTDSFIQRQFSTM